MLMKKASMDSEDFGIKAMVRDILPMGKYTI